MSHQHRAYSLTALFLFMTVVVVLLAIARSAMITSGTGVSRFPIAYPVLGFVGGVIIELFACSGYPPHAGARALGLAAGGAMGATSTALVAQGASLWSFAAGAVGLTLFGLLLRYLRRPEPAEATG